LPLTPSAKPEIVSYSGSVKPLNGVNTPAVNIPTYDLPLAKPKVVSHKLEGIEKAMKMIPVSGRREFAMFVHKHQASGQTAKELAVQFLASSATSRRRMISL
jgi:hypothetical protein